MPHILTLSTHTYLGRRGTGIGNVPIADNIYSSTGTTGWFGGGNNHNKEKQETNEDDDEDSPRARTPVRGVKNKIPRSWSQFWIKLLFGIEPTNHATVRRTWSGWWINLIMRSMTYLLWSIIKGIMGSPFLGSFTFLMLVLVYFRWFRG